MSMWLERSDCACVQRMVGHPCCAVRGCDCCAVRGCNTCALQPLQLHKHELRDEFVHSQVSRLFYDVRTLNLRHPHLMTALTTAARVHLSSLRPLEIGHTAASIADLGVRDAPLLDELADALHDCLRREEVLHAGRAAALSVRVRKGATIRSTTTRASACRTVMHV